MATPTITTAAISPPSPLLNPTCLIKEVTATPAHTDASDDHSSDELNKSNKNKRKSSTPKPVKTLSPSHIPKSKSKLNNISEVHSSENETDDLLSVDKPGMHRLSLPKYGNPRKESIRFTINDENNNVTNDSGDSKHKIRPSLRNAHNDESGHCDLYIELEELHFDENHTFFNSCNGDLSNYEWRIKTR